MIRYLRSLDKLNTHLIDFPDNVILENIHFTFLFKTSSNSFIFLKLFKKDLQFFNLIQEITHLIKCELSNILITELNFYE